MLKHHKVWSLDIRNDNNANTALFSQQHTDFFNSCKSIFLARIMSTMNMFHTSFYPLRLFESLLALVKTDDKPKSHHYLDEVPLHDNLVVRGGLL